MPLISMNNLATTFYSFTAYWILGVLFLNKILNNILLLTKNLNKNNSGLLYKPFGWKYYGLV